jgi:cell division inhibitor SepF
MASMWRRAMLYLGLGPDDEYDDDYDRVDDHHHAPVAAHTSRYAPPEPPEAPTATVRPLPREVEQPSGVTAMRRSPVVKPTSFNEAQDVADKFMAGVPVIVNLQGVDRDLSRRLVDFASGLCYGLRGQMERVTHQLYLLTPAHVEVSAEEKRRLRESE